MKSYSGDETNSSKGFVLAFVVLTRSFVWLGISIKSKQHMNHELTASAEQEIIFFLASMLSKQHHKIQCNASSCYFILRFLQDFPSLTWY
jgi:hypothetical protein